MEFLARNQRVIASLLAVLAGVAVALGAPEVGAGLLAAATALGAPRPSELSRAGRLSVDEIERLRMVVRRRDWPAIAGVDPETVTAVERALRIVRDADGPDAGGGA